MRVLLRRLIKMILPTCWNTVPHLKVCKMIIFGKSWTGFLFLLQSGPTCSSLWSNHMFRVNLSIAKGRWSVGNNWNYFHSKKLVFLHKDCYQYVSSVSVYLKVYFSISISADGLYLLIEVMSVFLEKFVSAYHISFSIGLSISQTLLPGPCSTKHKQVNKPVAANLEVLCQPKDWKSVGKEYGVFEYLGKHLDAFFFN